MHILFLRCLWYDERDSDWNQNPDQCNHRRHDLWHFFPLLFPYFSGMKKVSPSRPRTTPVKMHVLALVATQFITFRNSKFLCNAKRKHISTEIYLPFGTLYVVFIVWWLYCTTFKSDLQYFDSENEYRIYKLLKII